MNSEIIANEFENSEIRTLLIDGEPWFVAKDIAIALNYPKSSISTIGKLLKKIPDEWRDRKPIPTLGGKQELAIISEQGLYFFVNRSDKPNAIPFQKWVAGKVLPSIRKTGSYSTKPKEDIDLDSIKKRTELIVSSKEQFIAFEDVFYRIGITRKEELAITSNRAVAKETGVDFIELAELKGVSTPDRYFTVYHLVWKIEVLEKIF
jgi:prophage antirepressor-like protein